ncbi:MAG TPA: DUF6519 domain-containing protein [Nakamurella sp.]|nr:DUF6519 domain-containing protein [Nakamurella sp.]
MRGDFSRLVLGGDGSSRVLLQQGRVLLDSDWNEAVADLVTAQRRLAADLIGPHGGPADDMGFALGATTTNGEADLTIGVGCYYVDGYRVAVEADPTGKSTTLWSNQPFTPWVDKPKLPDPPYLVYLDVWEQHVSALQDDSIREVALGGPDTTSRARLVWQIRTVSIAGEGDLDLQATCAAFPLKDWRARLVGSQPLLRARAKRDENDDELCLASPDAGYRGVENQLYRVEVADVDEQGATFVWSRENGSVAATWTGTDVDRLHVEGVRDAVHGFAAGDWVELTWDRLELAGVAGTRVRITAVDGGTLIFDSASATGTVNADPGKLGHAIVRRWDAHRRAGVDMVGGAIRITEDNGDTHWVGLEDGIEVQFAAPDAGDPDHIYRFGDYWTIVARVSTGDIQWARGTDAKPMALPPQGIKHHYAPLAWFGDGDGMTELGRQFARLATCVPL